MWIKSHAEAIFNTTYWAVTPQEGNVRFTQTVDAFYFITLYAPNDTLVIDAPVPYVPGLDDVTVVGGNQSGTVVPSEVLANGSLQLNVSDEVRNGDQYAWVFKIAYDNSTSGSGSGSGGATASGTSPQLAQSTWILTIGCTFVVACFGTLL